MCDMKENPDCLVDTLKSGIYNELLKKRVLISYRMRGEICYSSKAYTMRKFSSYTAWCMCSEVYKTMLHLHERTWNKSCNLNRIGNDKDETPCSTSVQGANRKA